MDASVLPNQQELISVQWHTLGLVWRTCQKWWMIRTDRWRERKSQENLYCQCNLIMIGEQTNADYWIGTVIWNDIIINELFVLDRNTWHHNCVQTNNYRQINWTIHRHLYIMRRKFIDILRYTFIPPVYQLTLQRGLNRNMFLFTINDVGEYIST